MSVAGGVSRKTFTQFSEREKREQREKRCFHGVNSYQNSSQRIFNNRGTAFRLWDQSTISTNGIWPQQGVSDGHRDGDRIMCVGSAV